MKTLITADSVIDWTPELLDSYQPAILPLIVVLNDKEHYDGVDVNPDIIYDTVSKTGKLPKTAANGVDAYHNFFKKYTDQGYDIIHISLGAKFSSSHNHAKLGAEGLPVEVIDSASLSTGSGLLALYASQLAKENKYDYHTIADMVRSRVGSVQASFVIDKLDYLHKGGRCSTLALLGANLLRIKPCIEVHDGKMVVARKYRGKFDIVIKKYVEDTLKEFSNYDTEQIFLTYTKNTPEEYADMVEDMLKQTGIFKNIYRTYAGSTITAHCGPNTLGILYFNDGDHQ